MDKQKSNAYTGRFNGDAGRSAADSVPRRPQGKTADAARRPSGFGTAGQAAKAKPEVKTEELSRKELRAKLKREKKEAKERIGREPGRDRPLLRALLIVLAVVLVLLVMMVIIFGGEDKTYHQMPVIERETTAEFEPDETPMPGTEGL